MTVIHYWKQYREYLFYKVAHNATPGAWVEYLIQEQRIGTHEKALQNIIKLYMGEPPGVDDWKDAIKQILNS